MKKFLNFRVKISKGASLLILIAMLCGGIESPAQFWEPALTRELHDNAVQTLHSDTLHPALNTEIYFESKKWLFKNDTVGLTASGTPANVKVAPLIEANYELDGPHSNLFASAGAFVSAKTGLWQGKLALFGGYSNYNSNAFTRFDTTSIQPGYGFFQSDNRWLDATWLLEYQPAEFIRLAFGRGSKHTGNGMRSLLLDRQAAPYPFLEMAVDVKAFRYEFRLMKLREFVEFRNANQFIEKFAAMHQFSWNITSWLNVYGFESVVWGARDSVGYRGWELNYLNPAVFLRPVEFNIGSPDNVVIGLGATLKPTKNLMLYGQFVLDEFNLTYARVKETWWGNKYGIQAGMRWAEPLGIPKSWLQSEVNLVRPFTYTHSDRFKSYTHTMLPLAHPAGANFAEWLFNAGFYAGSVKLVLNASLIKKGMDTNESALSYGGDILKPYKWRNANFGIDLWNGQETTFASIFSEVALPVYDEFDLEIFFNAGLQGFSRNTDKKFHQYLSIGVRSGLPHPKTHFIY